MDSTTYTHGTGDVVMQGNRHTFGLVVTLATGIAATVLTPIAARQNDRITRPAVSEKASPLQAITPVAHDGYRGYGFLRKPPGDGPFPAVVLIHGGLMTWPSERLRQFVIASAMPSRFLAAGYVVATMTYRSRNVDPQSRVSLDDSLAAVEFLERRPYVNAASVVVYGCSGGGDLALAVASEKRVAAIVAEEPASIMFTGVWNSSSPKAGADHRESAGQQDGFDDLYSRYWRRRHARQQTRIRTDRDTGNRHRCDRPDADCRPPQRPAALVTQIPFSMQ